MVLHDVPQPEIDALFARGEPRESDRAFTDPWPLERWPDVPTRVLAGRHDRLLPFEFVAALARRRLGVEVEPLDTGHLPALARPDQVADRLLTAAPSTMTAWPSARRPSTTRPRSGRSSARS